MRGSWEGFRNPFCNVGWLDVEGGLQDLRSMISRVASSVKNTRRREYLTGSVLEMIMREEPNITWLTLSEQGCSCCWHHVSRQRVVQQVNEE